LQIDYIQMKKEDKKQRIKIVLKPITKPKSKYPELDNKYVKNIYPRGPAYTGD
jgi:hypothetical protein